MNEFKNIAKTEIGIYKTLMYEIIYSKNKECISILRTLNMPLRSMEKSKNIDEFNHYRDRFYVWLVQVSPALIKSKIFTKEEIMEMLQREGE